MNGVLYKYAINIWQTKYFQEIQKKIRREKRCFTSNPKIGYSYNKKKIGNSRKVLHLSPKCRKTK